MAFYRDLQQVYQTTQRRLPWAIVDRDRRSAAAGRTLPGATLHWRRLAGARGPPASTLARRVMNGLVPVGAREISADLPPEPFPGLRPFNPDEWAIFFGREPMIDEVIRPLAGQHLVVVHGASGCGKSSLVRAGVLPWLALDHARPACRGGRRSRAQPAARCATSRPSSAGRWARPRAARAIGATAWHDRLALGNVGPAGHRRPRSTPPARSLCLLVDQFEELFRWARDRSRGGPARCRDPEADCRRRAPPRLFVILTMRSDYLGACAGYEGFAETVNRCQYLLPRMDDFAILRAIHEPASLLSGAYSQRSRRPSAVRRPARAGSASRAPARSDARLP